MLATAEADVIEYLLVEYSVACPVLHRDRIEQSPVSEEVQSVPGWPSESYRQRMTKIVIAVPFDGDKEVFKLRPSNFTLNPPSAMPEENCAWLGPEMRRPALTRPQSSHLRR